MSTPDSFRLVTTMARFSRPILFAFVSKRLCPPLCQGYQPLAPQQLLSFVSSGVQLRVPRSVSYCGRFFYGAKFEQHLLRTQRFKMASWCRYSLPIVRLRFLKCGARLSAFRSAPKAARKEASARGGVEAQWTSVSNLFKGNGAKKDCTYLRSEWCSVWIEGNAGWWISDPDRKTERELFCNILLFCFACLSCWFHVLSLFISPLRVAITSGSLETTTVTDCVCNTVKYNVLD